MPLEERLETEFKAALKERDKLKLSTLRLLKADMNNVKFEHNKKVLTDGEITKIIQRQIKQRKDSIEQFEKGKRQDLAEKEKKEMDILSGYMPEQLPEKELKKIIEDTAKELEATSKDKMGQVMKAVMEKVKGRADGKKISQIVSGMLK